MPIVSVEIMKIIDEREKWDKKCVVIRWSNSKEWKRKEKRSIVCVRNKESNGWNRNENKKKTKKKNSNKDRIEQGKGET